MVLLSIHDGHNASAALFKDGVLLAAVSEERINRKKFFWGWPVRSIDFVLADSNIGAHEIDVVCVSHMSWIQYAKRKLSSASTYAIQRPKIVLGNFYNIWQAFIKERAVRSFQKKYCPNAVLFFCDHHRAHAASAFFCSGYTESLVVTCDNLGDSYSHTAYSVKDGIWNLAVVGDTNESLGAFYGAVTEGLGFKPNQHEGKLVGLAAYAASSVLIERMKKDFARTTKGGLHFKRTPYKKMVTTVKSLIQEGYTKEEIAAGAQGLLEEIMLEHVGVLLTKYPHTSICVAGGVFANVKLNQRIKDRFNVSIFIQPAMGDEGLVLGAAWQYMSETTSNFEGVGPLRHMYLGTHYTRADIMSVVENNSLYQIEPFTSYEQTADLLANGEIIGVFDGRMEFGPRALGARSIVVDPRDKKVNDLLNMRLQRSDFMPFAPSVLSEYADALFQNVEHARHAAEFMTITFDVKHEWQKKIPAIVHVDGTARPQLVRKDRNQSYWMLIHAFYEKTGIPLIMNTSFNMHEEPIVSSPQDALRSLETGAVDSILFNYEFFVRLRKK